MNQDFRELTDVEAKILERLLSVDFPGKEQLVIQSKKLTAKLAESGDDYGTLELNTKSKELAKVVQRVPVEAAYTDSDGVPIFVLLHVIDGLLGELEIYKADGNPIILPIIPNELKVIVRDSDEFPEGYPLKS